MHEFGHSLGLGHSSVKGAIMFPWYQNYDMDKDLPEDDRIAIQQIYGKLITFTHQQLMMVVFRHLSFVLLSASLSSRPFNANRFFSVSLNLGHFLCAH